MKFSPLLLIVLLTVLLFVTLTVPSAQAAASTKSKSTTTPTKSTKSTSDTGSKASAGAGAYTAADTTKTETKTAVSTSDDEGEDEVATIVKTPEQKAAEKLAAEQKAKAQQAEKERAARLKEWEESRKKNPDFAKLQRKKARLAEFRQKKKAALNTRLAKARKKSEALKKKRKDRKAEEGKRKERKRAREDAFRKRKLESEKPSVIASGVSKLAWMHDTAKSSKYGLIDISTNNFKKYIHATPRPYYMFVVFTALDNQYQCAMCKNVDKELKKLSAIYHQHRLAQIANTSNYDVDTLSESEKRAKMPIFFVQVDIESNKQIFQSLSLQSAPVMVLVPPTAKATPAPLATFLSSLPNKAKYAMQSNEASISDINDFIAKASGQSVALTAQRKAGIRGMIQLAHDILNVMDPVRRLLLFVGVAMIVLLMTLWAIQQLYYKLAGAYQSRQAAQGIVKQQTPAELVPLRIYSQYSDELTADAARILSGGRATSLGVANSSHFSKPRILGLFRWWFIVMGSLVYLFGISGGMYNILRGNSHFSWKGWNIWNYVQRGDSHDQSVLEGLFMGMLQLGCAFVLITMNRTTHTWRVLSDDKQSSLAQRVKRVAGWLLSMVWSPVLWGTAFFLLWRLIVQVYSKKNGGYNNGWLWRHMDPYYVDVDKLYRIAQKQALAYMKKVW